MTILAAAAIAARAAASAVSAVSTSAPGASLPAESHGSVRFVAACPSCGRSATWHGVCVDPGGATSYRIECLTVECDRPVTDEEEHG